ncbi:hypothetical protein GWK47_039454 [Chionoecetes opilio]|uniref:Uncharacterized protein n=1 Tax=Chionoecetes opilio TaxID=41210 RepID=A0A8J4YBI6_CHIOP|nr:hypothetical protein GWK47_039454 [Chionoecetes opilio]
MNLLLTSTRNPTGDPLHQRTVGVNATRNRRGRWSPPVEERAYAYRARADREEHLVETVHLLIMLDTFGLNKLEELLLADTHMIQLKVMHESSGLYSKKRSLRICCWTAGREMFPSWRRGPQRCVGAGLARERCTSTASPLVSTVLVLRGGDFRTLVTHQVWHSRHLCLVESTSAAMSLRCSNESRSPARVGLGGLAGIHQSQGSTLDAVQPPSVRGCTRHPGEGGVL